MTTTFQPGAEGIFFDVPAETYHSAPGFSHSMSKLMNPPVRLKADMDADDETEPDNVALILGTLVHAAILEPEKPLPKLVMKPEDPNFFRTNRGKQWRDEQHKLGKIILKVEELEAVNKMVDSVKAHKTCQRIFATGRSEVSIFERVSVELGLTEQSKPYKETQEILLKARMDWLPEGNALVYIKTVMGGGADPEQFQKILTERRYWTQATWYLDRYNAKCKEMVQDSEGNDTSVIRREPKENFVFIAVEKVPPYLVNTFYIDEDTLAMGRRQNARDIESYARCVKSGIWPGFDEEIKRIGLPEWEKKRINKLEHNLWQQQVKANQ